MKCEVDNKNEITTQDFLEKNTCEIVDMCVVLRRNIYTIVYIESRKKKQMKILTTMRGFQL